MSTPLIIWGSVAGLLVLLLIANIMHAILLSKHHIIRMGSEREEFYVPGDALHDEDLDEDL
ncbi:MAG: hypothetical protein K2M06_03440 [Muribaculaceae bacterium]|nr:hypothetical protein [Muribaculaceae bacterium]